MEEFTIHSDTIMKNVFDLVQRDLRSITGIAFQKWGAMSNQDLRNFRMHEHVVKDPMDPYHFKCKQQIMYFLKRYRFQDDLQTDDELLAQAEHKFMATQERIARPLKVDQKTFLVLQRARRICTQILGAYSEEDHRQKCRLGKRACKGIPLRESYLHTKLCGGKPYTGSQEHIDWFRKGLASDKILADVVQTNLNRINVEYEYGNLRETWGKPLSLYTVCDTLDLSFVPKSFKSLRSIKPNTLLGSFYTLGLGRLLEEKLKGCGLNVHTLQEKHKVLARKSSVTRHLVTADLSSASDSITKQLLRYVLPSQWYRVITYGRCKYYTIQGSKMLQESVATMGDGHTFPLQTLIFYCLVKAMGELVGRSHFVSVYGDDLIYSRHLHKYVASVFPRLHLQLNMEKTYVESYFRESCGGDYYHGVDVRPFSPEAESQPLCGDTLDGFCYKLLNGFQHRWDFAELPATVDYLVSLIKRRGRLLEVPPSYPDDSGLHVLKPSLEGYTVWCRSKHSWYFECLMNVTRPCEVHEESPYYWDKMRTTASGTEFSLFDKLEDSTILRITYRDMKGRARDRTYKGQITLVCSVPRKGSTHTVRQLSSLAEWR